MNPDTRLMLIDGHALVHRAYHALPEDLATSEGEQTNAVFGFSSMVLKAIDTVRPTHVIMALDRPVPTFRHEAFEGYKATRPPTPRPLISQFERVRQVAHAMNISIYEVDGYEADDVLGTLSRHASERSVPTTIVTGDLDTLQLVNKDVHVMVASRGVSDTTIYDEQAVEHRYGLEPYQLPDYKSLVGDTSDNIPGVRGIGDKTAARLLALYENLEGVFAHLDDLSPKVRKVLEEHREQAFASRELARIVCDVPVTLDLEHCAFEDVDRSRLLNLFRELEFRSLIPRVQEMMPRQVVVGGQAARTVAHLEPQQLSMFGDTKQAPEPESPDRDGAGTSVVTSQLGLLSGSSSAARTVTRVVRDEDDLRGLVAELRRAGAFAVDTETTSTDPLRAGLVGLSFATRPDQAWYVPVGHVEGDQLPIDRVLEGLRPLLEDASLAKTGHNLKYDYAVLAGCNVYLQGMDFDTMVAAYLVNPTARSLSLSSLAIAQLGIEMTPIEDLIGKGKSQITMDRVDIAATASYAGADADVTLRLREILQERLADAGLTELFHHVEMPLVPVLADMEREGVALDTKVLEEMSREMTDALGDLEGRIYEAAGHRFNISSTQQLGQVLFRELGLKAGRRTKTGYSTDSEVLEGLRGSHGIVDLVLEFRQLLKLKNTYVDALPSLISPQDGRVHTDFNQTATATGRLSSSSPNLQNIPIRSELGRRIRRAFVPARPDHVLLAADYSQIELRILAAMSHDPRLLEAFQSGADIHAATAAAVFGVPLEKVSGDQRRIAKVVNFGIIYGIGEQRLAHETGITREEAAQFIANYNRTYAGVKAFMDDMRKRAAFAGYVSTLLNRRRYIPDIHSTNPGIRTAAERAAINMPIQGTAADIIKIAMVRLSRALREQSPHARMVLQVHDELVFDAPASEVERVAPVVRETMEHAMDLEVPLKVEMKVGRDWYDMSPVEGEA